MVMEFCSLFDCSISFLLGCSNCLVSVFKELADFPDMLAHFMRILYLLIFFLIKHFVFNIYLFALR